MREEEEADSPEPEVAGGGGGGGIALFSFAASPGKEARFINGNSKYLFSPYLLRNPQD